MNSKCPLYHWDIMVRQIDMKVNLQQQSNTTPNVLAHAHPHRPHDINIYVAICGNRRLKNVECQDEERFLCQHLTQALPLLHGV